MSLFNQQLLLNYFFFNLEYRTAPKENGITLRDEDGSNEMESSWRKINTLSHYWIPDRAVFRLVTRHDRPAPGRGDDNIIDVDWLFE